MMNLSSISARVLERCRNLQDKDGPYGCYRIGDRQRPDLYSSLDIALIRAIMGEDLRSALTEQERHEWAGHINSFANHFHTHPTDGSYGDTFGHSALHANGMVVGALAFIGGKQRFPVRLYDDFDSVQKVGPWLERIDWEHQWPNSHLFWGGMVCFSLSRRSTNEWLEEVFRWLNANLDPRTGWWRRGTVYADRNQPLGGSVHILPIYQHHGRLFPYPERVIDSVLQLQLPEGRWLQSDSPHIMHYLDLDALYALDFMRSFVPTYRIADVHDAVARYAAAVEIYWNEQSDALLHLHPHYILAAVGTFGLLQRLLPEKFEGDTVWTDIFSDRRLHDTAAVEV